MEEILDSIQEQGSTNKSKSTWKDTPNEYSSSMPVSQSEESYNYGESEVMQSVSDKKSAKRGRKRNIKAQDKKSNEGDELDEDFENSRGVNNENSAEVNYRIRRCLVPLWIWKNFGHWKKIQQNILCKKLCLWTYCEINLLIFCIFPI